MIPILTIVIGILDQMLKYTYLERGSATINPGVAFGSGNTMTAILGIALLVTVGLAMRFQPRPYWLSLCLAASFNLLDRVMTGGVIDYLTVGSISLNLSDIAICILVLMIGLHIFRVRLTSQ